MSPTIFNNKQALFSMESNPIDASKKRNMKQLLASELNDRLRSKADYIKYLDQHRKYPIASFLNPLQFSTTCRRPAQSTRTS